MSSKLNKNKSNASKESVLMSLTQLISNIQSSLSINRRVEDKSSSFECNIRSNENEMLDDDEEVDCIDFDNISGNLHYFCILKGPN